MQKSTELSDMELIAQYRLGHGWAAEALFERYHPKLLQLSQRFFLSKDDAEEIAQKVLIKVIVHKKIFGFRGQSQLWSWFYRIAVNECKSVLRKKSVFHYLPEMDTEAISDTFRRKHETGLREASSLQAYQRGLQEALCKLPENYRRILTELYLSEKSYGEIACQLNISAATLRVQAKRAKVQLRHLYLIEKRSKHTTVRDAFLLHFETILSTS